MRIGFSAEGARRAVNEIITGLWSFTDAQGLLTDDINERTGGAGVTVDGLLIRDAGIPEGAVTAHEAALAILETQIPNGTVFPRLANTEIITGLWVFSHASGILVDIIQERIASAGVTIDGVLLKDGILDVRELAAANTAWIISNVVGDAGNRFLVKADGTMEWGDGVGARDTNLFRAAADELATSDDFNVGGALDLAGDIELSTSDLTLTTGSKNNVATGTRTVLRILLSTGVVDISGFAGGRPGRLLAVMNLGGSNLTLNDEDTNSTAANRMLFTGAADLVLAERDIALLWYDDNTSRWKLLSTTV